ncbi:D-alanyl-D-alanine carboxypeptidase/D-alanyl-D-alanine endopeptidase [Anatilimnocola floriformis]|uniref:D-alanyl-D-alanine carboxypeptidase/D-alanyl-D-alanine endopeptidase n=1 Tax=Anatilimnocola floriformis TaxID=2948575 RepID=UPI0020C295A7|nr:D-alanyl-D-alanine carboxypeptidase/D-alanyl-D-alanine-endopeptidase [Anatilimnocola floriformis]
MSLSASRIVCAGSLARRVVSFPFSFYCSTPMHISFRPIGCLLLGLCLAMGGFARSSHGQDSLETQVQALLDEPIYRQSHWGLLFVDLQSGDVVYEHNRHKLFAPASATKIFSTSAALDGLGADYRFRTPVFARGSVNSAGKLSGDLILRASGDPTLGGRTSDKGTIEFADSDHTYANWSSEAGLTPQEPLAGLNDLARQVRASGIRAVDGEVLVDDQLFERAESSGSGPKQVSPIVVNDNVIDLVLKPAEAGKPAEVTWRPHCGLLRVESRVETIAAGGKTEMFLRDHDGLITITGKLAADKQPVVRIQEVSDPAGWARSLFIEALERAGVTVSCSPSLKHPTHSLPSASQYAELKQVAELKSLPFSENAKLILKVSHNLHASELPLLLAASKGKKTLADGMKLQREFLQRCGVNVETISFGGGAGGARADYVTPQATVQLLQHLATRKDFAAFEQALPVMGVDGTLAKTVKSDSPVRGKVQAKTGTLVWDNVLNDQGLITSKALAGYLTTASGKRLAFAAFINGVPARDGVDSKKVGNDLGRLCEIIHRAK